MKFFGRKKKDTTPKVEKISKNDAANGNTPTPRDENNVVNQAHRFSLEQAAQKAEGSASRSNSDREGTIEEIAKNPEKLVAFVDSCINAKDKVAGAKKLDGFVMELYNRKLISVAQGVLMDSESGNEDLDILRDDAFDKSVDRLWATLERRIDNKYDRKALNNAGSNLDAIENNQSKYANKKGNAR